MPRVGRDSKKPRVARSSPHSAELPAPDCRRGEHAFSESSVARQPRVRGDLFDVADGHDTTIVE